MSIAISSQMNASLVALTQTNDDVTTTQGRLSTGLSVATAADNIAVYFKAKSYTTRADGLDVTNKNITQALANLDVVDKALVNMQESLTGAVQLMRDARAKAVTVTKNAITIGSTRFASNAVANPGFAVGAQIGDIVQPSGTNIDSSSNFQPGDAFAVTLTDSASGSRVTKYFRAVNPAAPLPTTAVNAAGSPANANGQAVAPAAAAAANGSTFNQAMNFNDLGSLSSAMQTAFGYDNVTMNLNTVGTGATATYALGFTLASATQAFTFAQTNDQAVAGNAGAAYDFTALFGKQQNAINTTYGTPAVNSNEVLNFLGVNGAALSVSDGTTYSSVGGPANASDVALQTRLDASNFFRQTLYGLDNLMKDAALPGYANVLRGDTMTVDLNETGDVKQTILLTQKADPLSLGFLGYTVSGQGVVNTTQTINNFNTDAAIDTSITQSTTAQSLLRTIQTVLAAAKTAMSSRLDYNKTVVTTLNTGANSMTATDTTLEASRLAALQNRQAFATNNMAVTKGMEQSLITILR